MTTTHPTRTPRRRRTTSAALSLALATAGLVALAPPAAAHDDPVGAVSSPIDIKPFSDPNAINLRRGGLVSVAILTTDDFDPFTDLDTGSLSFGPTGTEAAVVRCASEPEDLDGDGDGDLSCKFRNRDTGFAEGDDHGHLLGLTSDGTPFAASDAVRIVTGGGGDGDDEGGDDGDDGGDDGGGPIITV